MAVVLQLWDSARARKEAAHKRVIPFVVIPVEPFVVSQVEPCAIVRRYPMARNDTVVGIASLRHPETP